jgi:membrane protease YdiL (CAAX protease family)
MLKPLEQFLATPETTLFGKIRNILAGFTLNVLYTAIIASLLKVLFATEPIAQYGYRFAHEGLILFFFSVILAPLWEELAFRVLPLHFTRNNPKLLVPLVLLSSLIFGILHGGPLSILIQGVSGFIMACVYIKNGYSYISSVIYHMLWNGLLMAGVILCS